MSVLGKKGISIPTILLHEGEGLILTIECRDGTYYRGELIFSEDNMNCRLKDVTVTLTNGKTRHMEQAYVRGSQIVLILFPNLLENAPMFKRVLRAKQGKVVAGGLGMGRLRGMMNQATGEERVLTRARPAVPGMFAGGGARF
uniref:Small nuclear ribonucleoprotein Sm D3 n=1 Tax=Bicosoecida sp. CB-2014 TaxID=1486930 RepID=A0A7S1CRQ5_9STRA|mmetsp:Transcript_8147/g.28963  ORF Transcript_8147/g.28963 Transcript_8147/m.28963 type:complete len:143 (+) Transcript_8147:226-654(+)